MKRIRQIIRSERFRELIRFCLAGGLNTLLTYGVFSLMIFLGLHYVGALICDYSFAIGFSLIVNKYFTFKYEHAIGFRMVLRMALSYLAMFLLNSALLFVFVDRMKMNAYLAQAISSVVIAGTSFLMQRFLVFTAPSHEK